MVLYESDGILVRPPIPTRFGTHQDVFTKTGEYAAQDGSGPDDVLTPRQRTWRDGTLEFSVLLLGSDKFPSVSHMLTETYPTARTLMEFSQQSALTHGSHAPLPDTTQKQPNYERDFAALGRGTDDLLASQTRPSGRNKGPAISTPLGHSWSSSFLTPPAPRTGPRGASPCP